ncbi:MAG: hypothetical protein ABF747_06950 [Bifidobacterium sp.]|uniref:Transcriptional regulator n=1 Tax=Bifidobacterium fermentum TaxID=3059035 RepID=A0AB39U9M1_9BIFI
MEMNSISNDGGAMGTSLEFVEYVCDEVREAGAVRYRKMFGDYMVYVNDRPLLLLCDSIVYVKMLPCIEDLMSDAERGIPYPGAKVHYILDFENRELALPVIARLEEVTQIPKKRQRSARTSKAPKIPKTSMSSRNSASSGNSVSSKSAPQSGTER